MKNTGVTRQIDSSGRIVIPTEIRRNMHLTTGDLVEIFVEDDCVILKKYYGDEMENIRNIITDCKKNGYEKDIITGCVISWITNGGSIFTSKQLKNIFDLID